MFHSLRKRKGFTLVELLVVIALIGILSTIVFANIRDSRMRADDARRRADLTQIAITLRVYKEKYGTYRVESSGLSGTGSGWFSLTNGTTYTKSVAQALVDEGLLTSLIIDPNGLASAPSDGTGQDGGNRKGRSAYMIQADAGSFTLWASLAKPTPEDIATQGNCRHNSYDSGSYNPNPTSSDAKYGMNYCISN